MKNTDKEEQVAKRNAHKIPYTTKMVYLMIRVVKRSAGGSMDSGGGMMWQLYHATGNELYREVAIENEEKLDANLMNRQGMEYDSGFKWLPTAVAHYRLDGNGNLETEHCWQQIILLADLARWTFYQSLE